MIPALFALAAAMVIGGCAAVIQGFPYVRLESGLAMVIAGSVAASSGAVLFGLGVVAAGLRRVERAARLSAPRAPEIAPASAEGRSRLPPVLPPVPSAVSSPVSSPVPSPILPPTPAFVGLPAVEPPLDPARPRIEPSLGAPEARPAATAPPAAEIEPELPIPGLPPAPPAPEPAPEPEPVAEPARGIAPEDDLFAAPEASAEGHGLEEHGLEEHNAEDGPRLRPSLDAATDPEPKPARTVVGRYASGGNTYVMFEDGSIEADTPQGRFTFASLDELKAFVDGGGESGARGAA